jgi:uroporphyrinogen-III decarboxylase
MIILICIIGSVLCLLAYIVGYAFAKKRYLEDVKNKNKELHDLFTKVTILSVEYSKMVFNRNLINIALNETNLVMEKMNQSNSELIKQQVKTLIESNNYLINTGEKKFDVAISEINFDNTISDLDKILDKISKKGINSLNEIELKILNKYKNEKE